MGGKCNTHGEMRIHTNILSEYFTKKIEKFRHTCENNIKTDFQETECEIVYWHKHGDEPSVSTKAENILIRTTFEATPCTTKLSENGAVWIQESGWDPAPVYSTVSVHVNLITNKRGFKAEVCDGL
jgi:hypothetical protein